jgi:hypothetical protein
MILDKIQYSFIYFSYKSYRVKYRNGRGYQYLKYTDGAHRAMSILFALTMFIVSAILTGKVSGNSTNVFVALGSVAIMASYLDFSVSKKKMLKYRYAYADAKKYMLYYFLFLIALIAIAFLYTISFSQ